MWTETTDIASCDASRRRLQRGAQMADRGKRPAHPESIGRLADQLADGRAGYYSLSGGARDSTI